MSQSQPPNPQSNMDVDTMLDVYILDYLVKKKLLASAKVFQDETKVPLNVHAIDAPHGFLFEWWTIFWDIFVSRHKRHQGIMDPCDEAIRAARHHQQQQGGQHQSQNVVNVHNANNGNNLWVAESSTPMNQSYRGQHQNQEQMYGDNVGILMNRLNPTNHLAIEHQKQALVPTHVGMNNSMSSIINQSSPAPEALPSGAHAGTGVLNNLPLKGYPLMHQQGREEMRTLLRQQQGGPLPPQVIYRNQMEGQFQAPNERNITQTESQFHPSNEKTISQIERQLQPSNEKMICQMEGQFQSPNERKRSQIECQLQPTLEKKRRHPLVSSGVANCSGTTNVIEVCSSSAEVSKPVSPHNDKINIDDFLNYGVLDGKEPDMYATSPNGFTFLEIGSLRATSVSCCDISFDGNLVVIGGQDRKATLWCTNSQEAKIMLDGHLQAITDIRFSPSMLRIATSSHDKTIRIWDLENPSNAIRTFTGHTASVMSLDFHPIKEDCICSCDENEIRYWTIKSAGCVKVAKGGASLVRFQSGVGKYLAAVAGKSVSLVDLENPQGRKHVLKGHGSNVQSICWDASGEHLVSVSEDLVKVLRMDSGGKANCIHELSVTGKRFRCGAFHPCYPELLIIGCYESLELWNMAENKLNTAKEEPVYALAVSKSTSGLIASAGHSDNVVKLWK